MREGELTGAADVPQAMRGSVEGGRWRALWRRVRRPTGLLVLLAAIWYLWLPVYSMVLVLWMVTGNGRRFELTTSGLLVSGGDPGSAMFRDSVMVVELGAEERAPYPIWVRVNYAGTVVRLREMEIRQAVEAAIKARRGATYTMRAARFHDPGPTPGVVVAYDFWGAGDIRTDIILRCLQPQEWPGEHASPIQRINSSRSGLSEVEHLTEHVGRQLTLAAQERCPGQRAFMVHGQDGEYVPIDPMASPREVVAIRVMPDTLRLAVGDLLPLASAVQVTAVRADGSAVMHFAPRYTISSPVIVQLGKGGFRALAPGIATVTVRPLVAGDDPQAARATFVVKVQPKEASPRAAGRGE